MNQKQRIIAENINKKATYHIIGGKRYIGANPRYVPIDANNPSLGWKKVKGSGIPFVLVE